MKLSELDPHWIFRGGQKVALIFRCPHCRQQWLSCTFVEMQREEQMERFGYAIGDIVLCKTLAWGLTAPEYGFEGVTITPSIDASAAGHWHGFITNGAIA